MIKWYPYPPLPAQPGKFRHPRDAEKDIKCFYVLVNIKKEEKKKMNFEKLEQSTAQVAREGTIVPSGRYLAEAANFLEVHNSKSGKKSITMGFNLKTDLATNADVTGYSMQKLTIWGISESYSGKGKDGKPYSIDNEKNLFDLLNRTLGSETAVRAVAEAIDAADATNGPVQIFGFGAKPITTSNGDVVVLAGNEVVAKVKQKVQTEGQYAGRTSVELAISKAPTL